MKTGNLLLVWSLIVLLAGSVWGLGISIQPGATLTFLRELGDEVELPKLKIINVNDSPMEYSIEAVAECRLKGYYPIPDIEWVRLGKDKVEVPPNDSTEISIFLRIPDDPAHLNRAWGITISVSQKPKAGENSGFAAIELGAHANWFVETNTVVGELSNTLDEPLVVNPGIWFGTFAEDEPTEGELSFKLLNNDDKTHTYTFENYTPEYGNEIRGQKLDIIPLIGDETSWISDAGWVQTKKSGFAFFKSNPKIKLNPGESAEQAVLLNIPREAIGDKIYESLVFIKVDGEYKGGRFVRFIFR